jgi:hypothetical protein
MRFRDAGMAPMTMIADGAGTLAEWTHDRHRPAAARRHAMSASLLAVLAVLAAVASPALAQEPMSMPQAVSTPGTATLKLCRSWILWESCREYGKVAVPGEITVGVTFPIDFGSNPKTINFTVKSITHDAGECRILRMGEEGHMLHSASHPVDMLIVRNCRPAG